MNVRFLPCGDSGLTIEFGNEISEQINRKVCSLGKKIKESNIRGVVEIVPTFRSLFVTYNPICISYSSLVKKVKALISDNTDSHKKKKRVIEIPVCYGGEYGEDLNWVAEHAGLTPKEVIEIHSKPEYLIYMLGFLPGFAYLGGLDKRIYAPRLENPRTRIPAGSVGIGGEQTGIYSLDSPGGWRLIGKTPVKPYDSERDVPILYQAGDYIKFVPITEDEFLKIQEKGGR